MGARRRFFVGGNWKMNGDESAIARLASVTLAKVAEGVDKEGMGLTSGTVEVDVVVAPPSPYLVAMRDALGAAGAAGRCFMACAQNVHQEASGAFTGEVSRRALADLAIPWVIIGHSERRTIFGEDDAVVAAKVEGILGDACTAEAVRVIACIGESLAEREAGLVAATLERQLAALYGDGDRVAAWRAGRVVIAYEPIWAIGTGRVASPAQAEEAHALIRGWVSARAGSDVADSLRIIYGGSVSGENCRELARMPNVDGFLVGGASLKDEFWQIVSAASAEEASH